MHKGARLEAMFNWGWLQHVATLPGKGVANSPCLTSVTLTIKNIKLVG